MTTEAKNDVTKTREKLMAEGCVEFTSLAIGQAFLFPHEFSKMSRKVKVGPVGYKMIWDTYRPLPGHYLVYLID